MSRDLGRDVPDLEKLYARKLWADFSYPNRRVVFGPSQSCVQPRCGHRPRNGKTVNVVFEDLKMTCRSLRKRDSRISQALTNSQSISAFGVIFGVASRGL